MLSIKNGGLLKKYSSTLCLKINNNRNRQFTTLLASSSLLFSFLCIKHCHSSIKQKNIILKKSEQSRKWPFAKGKIISSEIEKYKFLSFNIQRLSITYEYELGTSNFYIKHDGMKESGFKRLFVDKESDKEDIPPMHSSIYPEELIEITNGKKRIFKNDRVFWTVPYFTLFTTRKEQEEPFLWLESLKQKYQTNHSVLIRFNPLCPNESVLEPGKQPFDRSTSFTYIYCSICVVGLLLILTLLNVILPKTYFNKDDGTSIEMTIVYKDLLFGSIKNTKESIEWIKKNTFSDNFDSKLFFMNIRWYYNEILRFIDSTVWNKHEREALPPPEVTTKKPEYINPTTLLPEEKNK
ncbi:hypothetical protein ABK040_006731 [Willaertia magna]